MKNTDNLMTPQELNARLTPEERKENARKAGKASAEARKERKLIKERILERMNESDWDAMIDALIDRAKKTDKGFEVLRDTIGQKPTTAIGVSTIDDESARLVDEYFARRYNGGLNDEEDGSRS